MMLAGRSSSHKISTTLLCRDPLMASPRVSAFLEQLRDADLLSPAQLNEARNHPLAQGEEPLPLAKDLIIRGWMTGFQAKLLILGRGRELVLGPYRLQE